MSHDSGYHETDSPKSLAPSQNNDHGYIEPGGSSPDLDPCSPGDAEDYGMDVPINQRNDIGLSDQELVMMSTKDLNKKLKKNNITKDRQKELKQERRTLKNRGYAANCRVKRETEEKTLEKRNEKLRKDIWQKTIDINEAKKETRKLMARFQDLEHECQKLQKEHQSFLMERRGGEGQDICMKALLERRTEIKWEKVKEEPPSPDFLRKCSI